MDSRIYGKYWWSHIEEAVKNDQILVISYSHCWSNICDVAVTIPKSGLGSILGQDNLWHVEADLLWWTFLVAVTEQYLKDNYAYDHVKS